MSTKPHNTSTIPEFSKTTLIIFVVSSVLFGLLASLVVNNLTLSFDDSALLWINQHASPALDSFFVALTQLGGVIVVAPVTALIIGYLIYKKQYDKAVFVAAAIGGVAIVNITLKGLFDRARPDLWQWIVNESSFSFPSGHASASFALALTIVLLLWQTKWQLTACIAAGVYVLLIGTSRLYLGVHFPTDILGGWLLATLWVTCSAGIISYVYSLRNARK